MQTEAYKVCLVVFAAAVVVACAGDPASSQKEQSFLGKLEDALKFAFQDVKVWPPNPDEALSSGPDVPLPQEPDEKSKNLPVQRKKEPSSDIFVPVKVTELSSIGGSFPNSLADDGSSSSESQFKKREKPHLAELTDTTPPSLEIFNVSDGQLRTSAPFVTIKGKVTDETGVAEVLVNGKLSTLKSNHFSKEIYVSLGQHAVQVEAIDLRSNKTTITFLIIRERYELEQISLEPIGSPTIHSRSDDAALALIIGIETYKTVPRAEFAINDATKFKEMAIKTLGIPPSRVKILLDQEASLINIRRQLHRWIKRLVTKRESNVYIFFAGHGLATSNGADLYLLPYDGIPNTLELSALKRSEFLNTLSQVGARSVTFFMDTCYSGITRTGETLVSDARPIFFEPRSMTVPDGIDLITATSGEEISSSLNDQKHGLFSYFLLDGLKGKADKNSDRQITIGELHTYVARNVQRHATRMGREQHPRLYGDNNRVLVSW